MIIKNKAPNLTIETIVFSAAADFIPRETIKNIIQINEDPNTTVGQPCFNSTGKNSPKESFSITAKALLLELHMELINSNQEQIQN